MKKHLYILLSGLLLLGITGFYGTLEEKEEKKEVLGKESLEGTWRLISYKYGEDGFFSEVPKFMEYRKILTKKNYTWVSYGENGDDVIGSGGGTYTLKGGKYVEHIDFFHPYHEGLIGTSTEFDSKMSGNTWSISGTIRSIKINPKTKKKEVIKETKLSEVWERVE